ncbi:unnamed protein product [Prorocentrum cordatum]|uniref:Uncharacterized protein n=1 Tax=Prorocentrum cordatum TaxID=2364126 RepID=A0ABN9QHU1_9DINO|nr:unnamed protein product [Polarella glacialis]
MAPPLLPNTAPPRPRTYFRSVHLTLNHFAATLFGAPEDRGQWVVSVPEHLGDSSIVRARVSSRAWWPWEAHLGSCTSPSALGALVPTAVAPPWEGSKFGYAARAPCWEAYDGEDFRPVPHLAIRMEVPSQCEAVGREGAQHPFLGAYDLAEMLGGRPYFVQRQPLLQDDSSPSMGKQAMLAAKRCFVIWYSEDSEHWVVTEDFRLLYDLLDSYHVSARAADTCWTPWEVAGRCWEVPDGSGGWVRDPELSIRPLR